MKTIKPFIDLGFHTVPLKGVLKRDETGKKTVPKFEKDWRVKYQTEFNSDETKIGGAITGSISGIVAIDCDSTSTYDLFKSLDKENTFHFVSKGKPKGGGTIIYAYPTSPDIEIIPSFSLQDGTINIDYYSDNGFVYLPTDSNESKEKWPQETFEDLPPLLGMPSEVYTLLTTLYHQAQLNKARNDKAVGPLKTVQLANYLAPAVELMLEKETFSPALFRIITPKDFRSLPQYVKHGYLHPENVPEGRGSEYLSKVSAILGADSSIEKSLYEKTLKFINDLWEDPIPQKRLVETIIRPMQSGNATINGEPIWTYDKEWKSRGFSFINKLGEAVEVFFDDVRCQYYLINFTQDTFQSYYKDNDIFSYIDTVGLGLPPRKNYKSLMPLVRTINDPSQQFGFFSIDEYTRSFNTFNQTPELAILTNPESYESMYTKPTTTLEYFKSLIPHNPTRHYVLRFMRKKLTTFQYSPVILYFLGVPGSGKDTFVKLIAKIIGEQYIAKPSTKEFLEQYNGWIVDKYFVQLDEYGNQLSRYTDKQEALGKIKAYTGKSDIQVREMRTDGFNYHHKCSFIMTANSNPLLIEDGDRRAFIISTPNNMARQDFVERCGGLRATHDKIEAEIKDFCYYLATEVDDMSFDEYMIPPYSKAKHAIIASNLPAGTKLAYFFKNRLFSEIEGLMEEYEVTGIFDHANEQRVYEEDLFELYSCMTDQAGVKHGLSLAMKDADMQKIPTTRNMVKSYYYKVPELQYYTTKAESFDEITIDLGD